MTANQVEAARKACTIAFKGWKEDPKAENTKRPKLEVFITATIDRLVYQGEHEATRASRCPQIAKLRRWDII